MATSSEQTTLEFFGATTFRLNIRGVTIFLDTWLDRPDFLPEVLPLESVTKCDYIFISHAHFDHMPGADRIAINTGAIIVANNEAIHLLRDAGVPEHQLYPVQGGERLPLFTRETRDKAAADKSLQKPGFPGSPMRPLDHLAALEVHIWPSLHCFLPDDHPEIIDTGAVYTGTASPYVCTLDVTFGHKYGFFQFDKVVPADKFTEGHKSFMKYIGDRKRNVFSNSDGGQLMYNFVAGSKAILWSAQLSAYDGVVRDMQPKPDVAIMAITGRPNLNGKPFDGSSAQFAAQKVEWLGKPKQVIWCLHDQGVIPPWYTKTEPATQAVEANGVTKVLAMDYAKPVVLDI